MQCKYRFDNLSMYQQLMFNNPSNRAFHPPTNIFNKESGASTGNAFSNKSPAFGTTNGFGQSNSGSTFGNSVNAFQDQNRLRESTLTNSSSETLFSNTSKNFNSNIFERPSEARQLLNQSEKLNIFSKQSEKRKQSATISQISAPLQAPAQEVVSLSKAKNIFSATSRSDLLSGGNKVAVSLGSTNSASSPTPINTVPYTNIFQKGFSNLPQSTHSKTEGLLKLNNLGSNPPQEPTINPVKSFQQIVGVKSKCPKILQNHYVRTIAALEQFYGQISKEQMRIQFIKSKDQKPVLLNEANVLPKNNINLNTHFSNSINNPPTNVNPIFQTPQIPNLFTQANHNFEPIFKDRRQSFLTHVQNNQNTAAFNRPFLDNLYFLNNLKGLDPNLQILFPQLLLSLQTTQDLTNKVTNLLFNAPSSAVQIHSNHNKVYSYWVPLLGNFSITPTIQIIEKMRPEQLKEIKSVRIWNNYGQVQFLEPISLFAIDLQESLKISQDSIQIIHCDLQKKRVRMTFRNFGSFTNLKGEQRQAMLRRMRKWIGKCRMRQVSHDKMTGDLVVQAD